jgi:hypothetical protein
MSKTIRNPVAIAMGKRYGKTTTVMHDRRQERGGSKNSLRDMLEEVEEFRQDEKAIPAPIE